MMMREVLIASLSLFVCISAQSLPCDPVHCAFCVAPLMQEQCPVLCSRDCINDNGRFRQRTAADRPSNEPLFRRPPDEPATTERTRAVGRRENIETLLHDLLPSRRRNRYTRKPARTTKPTPTYGNIFITLPVGHIPVKSIPIFTLPTRPPLPAPTLPPANIPPQVIRVTLPPPQGPNWYDKLPKPIRDLIVPLLEKERANAGIPTQNQPAFVPPPPNGPPPPIEDFSVNWNGPPPPRPAPSAPILPGPQAGSILDQLIKDTRNPPPNAGFAVATPRTLAPFPRYAPTPGRPVIPQANSKAQNLQELLNGRSVSELINDKDALHDLYDRIAPNTPRPRRPATVAPSGQCPKQPGWRPCIGKPEANERFHKCCAPLGEQCASLCNYDMTQDALQGAVLRGACPLHAVPMIVDCLSQKKDATKCCEAKGVFIGSRSICKPFCNPSLGLPGAEPQYFQCLSQLSSISYCFWAGLDP